MNDETEELYSQFQGMTVDQRVAFLKKANKSVANDMAFFAGPDAYIGVEKLLIQDLADEIEDVLEEYQNNNER